jgi:DNA gyrase subunit A
MLYSFSLMQDTVGVIMLALVNGVPKVMDSRNAGSLYRFPGEIITAGQNTTAQGAGRELILEGSTRL